MINNTLAVASGPRVAAPSLDEAGADKEAGITASVNRFSGADDSADELVDADAQAGVKNIEATTMVW